AICRVRSPRGNGKKKARCEAGLLSNRSELRGVLVFVPTFFPSLRSTPHRRTEFARTFVPDRLNSNRSNPVRRSGLNIHRVFGDLTAQRVENNRVRLRAWFIPNIADDP